MSGFDSAVTFIETHPMVQDLFEFVTGALTIAVISTWPKLVPRTLQDWWDWARSSLQTAVPAARQHSDLSPAPTPEPPPPQPPKENP